MAKLLHEEYLDVYERSQSEIKPPQDLMRILI